MTKIEEIDLEREDVKKFRTLLANYSYGMATFILDENQNPKYIRLDGATYDVKNNEHIHELAEHFVKIDEAVKKVEESYTKLEELPEHIDKDVYNYHPRWIQARKQYNMIPRIKEEIECPLEISTHVKTFFAWNQFFWISIGQTVPECNIPNHYKMDAAEYEKRDKEINFLTNKEYFAKQIYQFLKYYKGDSTEIRKCAQNVLNCRVYSEEYEKLKESVRDAMFKLDYVSDRKAIEKINREFYHRDLNAFFESVNYCALYFNNGVTMEFAEDNFPLVVFKGKKYDFRNSNSKRMFLNTFTKPKKINKQQKNANAVDKPKQKKFNKQRQQNKKR